MPAMIEERELGPAYADAWDTWAADEADAWEPTARDGLSPRWSARGEIRSTGGEEPRATD
jgi:hypothetical protein